MLSRNFINLKKIKPRVHCITNYVTVNDCANILLASGASPIMADDINEVMEITKSANALYLNLGTLNENRVMSMLAAGKVANDLNIPVVLDPVGVGASNFRMESAKKLLNNIKFSAIRGNSSEINALYEGKENATGVDSLAKNTEGIYEIAKELAVMQETIVAVTGSTDYVTDGITSYEILNGHQMMSAVTGTGCMLSALIAAYLGANPSDKLSATATALCEMGLVGEIAHKRLGKDGGNATYRNYLIDGIYNLSEEELMEGAKYEIKR